MATFKKFGDVCIDFSTIRMVRKYWRIVTDPPQYPVVEFTVAGLDRSLEVEQSEAERFTDYWNKEHPEAPL